MSLTDIISLVSFGAFTIGALLWLLFHRKKKKSSRLLHGFDLNKWHYLGYTTPEFVYSKNDKEKIDVALFVRIDDDSRRAYKMLGSHYQVSKFADHPYMNRVVKPWAAGTGNLYTPVLSPSEDLKNRLRSRGYEWDDEKNCWKKVKFDIKKDSGSNVITLERKS